jgi:hypothetical protein
MSVLDPQALVEGVCRVDIGVADRLMLLAGLESLRRVRARADLLEVAIARQLELFTPLGERDVSRAANRSSRHGERVRDRAKAIDDVPALGEALADGVLSGEHADSVAKALRAAPAAVRNKLAESAKAIVGSVASSGSTPEELSDRLTKETSRLEGDAGESKLVRQRRNTRLRTWTDKTDGMFKMSGCFDPATGVLLHGRLQAAMAAMFADGYPSIAPEDPADRQHFLRALALIALTAGFGPTGANQGKRAYDSPNSKASNAVTEDENGFDCDGTRSNESASVEGERDVGWAPFSGGGLSRFGRSEVVVVVDIGWLDQNGYPITDWGLPVDLPWSSVTDLCNTALVSRIVVNNGVVVEAPGDLNVGRSTRLASRAQRRALQGLYATCAIPGCCVPYEYAKLHHVIFWRHGGPTDLVNLLPLCWKHHDKVHNGGWQLLLGPNRELTVTMPDGTQMTTGPPSRAPAE